MAEPRPVAAGIAWALLALGFAQMTFDLAGCSAGKAVAGATMASPAPRVFSSAGGLETFSARYFVEWADRDGAPRSLELDRRTYARLRGPYNRRNVYGAFFAYGPVLAADDTGRRLLEEIGRNALSDDSALLRELGVDPFSIRGEVRLRCAPLPGAAESGLPLIFFRRAMRAGS